MLARSVLSRADVMTELRGPEAAWNEEPLPSLVQHIVSHHHARLREQLRAALGLARAARAPRLARVLASLQGYALLHMEKEERVLFPLLLGAHSSSAAAPVQTMEVEHRDHLETLRRLCALSDALEQSDAARRLRTLLEEVLESEVEHIHLENDVLFRRALCESF